MNEILKTISNIGIVPVVAINDASKAVPLAKALVVHGAVHAVGADGDVAVLAAAGLLHALHHGAGNSIRPCRRFHGSLYCGRAHIRSLRRKAYALRCFWDYELLFCYHRTFFETVQI